MFNGSLAAQYLIKIKLAANGLIKKSISGLLPDFAAAHAISNLD